MITIRELLDMFTPDTIRFYFTLNNPEKKDINFNIEDIINTHNKILVGGFGNFVNRNLSFLKKEFDGFVHEGTIDAEVASYIDSLYASIGGMIEKGSVRGAAEEMLKLIQYANKYYDDKRPWVQVKQEDLTDFYNTTATCVHIMANMGVLFSPVIPDSCGVLREILGMGTNPAWETVRIPYNFTLGNCPILFNRIQK